ncbi:nuclear transport factor 2 family protein [Actinacidiphila sp. bgisy145]|uniref:nuclear transport factor 2 family protein n=1 Tax=Actinacidiphila sp. bgisy145 TaxID=3413792 RepID=UPI003EB7A5E7
MTSTDTAVDRFRTAVEQRDLGAMTDLFTEDVRLYSPVKFRPFEGRDQVLGLLGVLLRTFEDFRYVGRLDGSALTLTDDGDTPAAVLLFRATINGRDINGIDLIHLDDAGRIREFTVMVRPQSAVHTLGEAVLAGLTAAGLTPAQP